MIICVELVNSIVKLILTSLLLFLLCLHASAQQPLRVFQTSYVIDANSGLEEPAQKYAIQYDATGRERSKTLYYWKKYGKTFGPQSRTETKYDEAGRLSLVQRQFFQNLSNTVGVMQMLAYTYNEQGKVKEYTGTETYRNDPEVRRFTTSYTYAENGCTQTKKYESFRNDELFLGYNSKYTNDEQCRTRAIETLNYSFNVSYATYETYDYEGSNVTAYRSYFILDGDTSLNNENLYSYNKYGNLIHQQRTNVSKTEFSYDSNQKLTYQKSFAWNRENETWRYESEIFYQYDKNGLLLMRDEYYVGFSLLNEFEYDSNNRLIRNFYRYIFMQDGVEVSTGEQRLYYRCDGTEAATESYSLDSGTPKLFYRTESEYLLPAACDPKTDELLTIFPNPTAGPSRLWLSVPVERYQLRVYNITGQLIHDEFFNNGVFPAQVDFSALPSGNYVVEVSTDSFKTTSRLVKN